LNWLDFNPSCPKNPLTLGHYIRKFRKEKGLLIQELAEQLGVTEDTVINWEKRVRAPNKGHMGRLGKFVSEIAKFFKKGFKNHKQ